MGWSCALQHRSVLSSKCRSLCSISQICHVCIWCIIHIYILYHIIWNLQTLPCLLLLQDPSGTFTKYVAGQKLGSFFSFWKKLLDTSRQTGTNRAKLHEFTMPSLPSLPSLPLTTEAACAIGSAQEGATSMLQASDDSMWLDVTRCDSMGSSRAQSGSLSKKRPETTGDNCDSSIFH